MNLPIRKIKNTGHLAQAVAANVVNKFPGKRLIVIGVTGTDGKTTTSNLLYHMLTVSGKKAALISTLGAIIDGKNYNTGFHVTTPSSFAIQKYLKIARQKGCTHIVLEVTSHALDQNRVWGVKFQIGVLTNITHEHLDYHKSYEKYVETKMRLLTRSERAVVNSNGEWFAQIQRCIPKEKVISYSLLGVKPDDITLAKLPFEVHTKLIGDFNLENILAAAVTAQLLGVEAQDIDRAIRSFESPIGRQEIIKNDDILVMVDFAHTPNSFENILPEVRKRTSGRLIHVFGAAGQRDRGKRPEMGKVASFYDDVIILTAEDNRDEKVEDINGHIKEGIGAEFSSVSDDKNPVTKTVFEIENRREAIEFAIGMAQKNDTVIITGKGHETSLNTGRGEEEWSDQNVARKALDMKMVVEKIEVT